LRREKSRTFFKKKLLLEREYKNGIERNLERKNNAFQLNRERKRSIPLLKEER